MGIGLYDQIYLIEKLKIEDQRIVKKTQKNEAAAPDFYQDIH